MSRLVRYFRKQTAQNLPDLGLITLQDYEAPALTVVQPPVATVGVGTGPFGSREPLLQPGFLGQLYIHTNLNDSGFPSGRGGIPVGPVAPVRHEAPNPGHWEVGERQIISGIPVPPAQEDQQPGSIYRVQLRVWDGAAGSTYEESLRNGGQTGFAFGTGFDNFDRITAFPRLSSAPSTIHLQPVTLGPPKRSITVPPGLGLFSNPTTNAFERYYALDDFFSDLPDGLLVFHFDSKLQSYRFATRYGAWFADSSTLFAPGEGFFLFNPLTRPITMIFPGAHGRLPALVRPTGQARFESRGNTLGRSASWEELTGLVPTDGDALFRYQGGDWQVNSYSFGTWDRGNPLIPANEAVFILLQP
ncbi:MAG: hypothetical protein IT581_22705 [Verrucomicrobiales bacterium]|nr:hypothetical protein [Verrucomicrobiales bacterium]